MTTENDHVGLVPTLREILGIVVALTLFTKDLKQIDAELCRTQGPTMVTDRGSQVTTGEYILHFSRIWLSIVARPCPLFPIS